ncbi:MAG: ATPase [Flavobacteriales bacterium]|nr:ATPase [Flavobacteriales bacterium]
MILIADSGSSKTDWRLIDSKGVSQYSCIGLNPDFVDSELVTKSVSEAFDKINLKSVTDVHFYGSGCSSESRNKIVKIGLAKCFINAQINIYHDLLGAARAACGKERGIAGILGTGSNCCLFDGKEVIQEFRSGGFVIGDEGGGVDIAKRIVKSFIEGRFDEELQDKFQKRYQTSVDEILENLYKKSQPNKYLASFSQFALHNKENTYISTLIEDSFHSYFKNQVMRYEEYQRIPLSLVGSIAFYYQEIFRSIASEYGVQIGIILEKPISGLTLYHTDLS